MATSRRYRVEIMNYLYKVKRETVDSAVRDELEDARRSYISSFAEAQMTASLQVLAMVDPFNAGLSRAYRSTKHLEDGEPELEGTFEEIEAYLHGLWSKWNSMRQAMQHDLDVQD